jgi:hypothetical protein
MQHIVFTASKENKANAGIGANNPLDDEEMVLWANLFDVLGDFDLEAALKYRFEMTAGEAREQERLLADMIDRVSKAMQHPRLRYLNADVPTLVDISHQLSADVEAQFISGAYFVERIADIVKERYRITHSDSTRVRLVTNGYEEVNMKRNALQFTMRDLGGDALNQNLWASAIEQSAVTIFVVSLADYTKKEGVPGVTGAGSGQKTKFQAARLSLWEQLNSKTRPKIVVLFNKQDQFRFNLKSVPLSTSSDFTAVADADPKAPHSWYCRGCEAAVVAFFKEQPPAAVELHTKDQHYVQGYQNEIAAHFLTSAAHTEKFEEIISKLAEMFEESDTSDSHRKYKIMSPKNPQKKASGRW